MPSLHLGTRVASVSDSRPSPRGRPMALATSLEGQSSRPMRRQVSKQAFLRLRLSEYTGYRRRARVPLVDASSLLPSWLSRVARTRHLIPRAAGLVSAAGVRAHSRTASASWLLRVPFGPPAPRCPGRASKPRTVCGPTWPRATAPDSQAPYPLAHPSIWPALPHQPSKGRIPAFVRWLEKGSPTPSAAAWAGRSRSPSMPDLSEAKEAIAPCHRYPWYNREVARGRQK